MRLFWLLALLSIAAVMSLSFYAWLFSFISGSTLALTFLGCVLASIALVAGGNYASNHKFQFAFKSYRLINGKPVVVQHD